MNDPIISHNLFNAFFTSRVLELSPSPVSTIAYNKQGHPEPNTVLSNFIAISSILEYIYSNDYM